MDFVRAAYEMQLGTGLSSLVMTNVDSKFKKEIIECVNFTKNRNHQAAWGDHDTTLVERFNRLGVPEYNNGSPAKQEKSNFQSNAMFS